jgi:hypothetical protein
MAHFVSCDPYGLEDPVSSLLDPEETLVPPRQSRCLTCRLNARSIMMSLSHWRGGNFEVESVKFFGGPGCAFILNGMVFRIPLPVKSFMAPLRLSY